MRERKRADREREKGGGQIERRDTGTVIENRYRGGENRKRGGENRKRGGRKVEDR